MKAFEMQSHLSARRIVILTILAVSIGLTLFAPAGAAQSGAGSIQGTVTDLTGAVIPNVAVHVVNSTTGVVSNGSSNGVGFYQIPYLFTGTYVLTFSAKGMKTVTETI